VISDRLRLTVLAGFLDRRIGLTPDFGYSRHPQSIAVRLKKTRSKSELIRKRFSTGKLLTIQLKDSPPWNGGDPNINKCLLSEFAAHRFYSVGSDLSPCHLLSPQQKEIVMMFLSLLF